MLHKRHMVRSFSGRVPDEWTVRRVLTASRHAPSAGNTRGWRAVCMVGPEQTARFWAATTTAGWRESSRRWPGLSRAPVVVALFCSPAAYLERYSEADKAGSGLGLEGGLEAWPVPYWFLDAGFAALTMLLAAADAGLGACFLGNFRGEDELKRTLEVPQDGWRYVGAVLFGEAGGSDPPSTSLRRTTDVMTHNIYWNRWKTNSCS